MSVKIAKRRWRHYRRAGQGNNIIFGDNGQITAAAQDIVDAEGLPIQITLGLVETIEPLIGGSDTITTGVGRDIVLGWY